MIRKTKLIYYSIEGRVSNRMETFIVDCLNDLLPKHPEQNVDILIRMRDKLSKSWMGSCCGDTEQVTIEISRKYRNYRLGKGQIASTLAHELTHAKQFILGEINMVDHVWKNEIDCSDLPYDATPWEIEANEEEIRLLKTYWRN